MTDTGVAAAPAVRWQDAIIMDRVLRTSRITSFFLAPGEPFAFKAGQHVDIRLTAPDGYRAIRSYSIASPPASQGIIELAIERLDGGEVSPFFHETAAIGDRIELRGPLGGHFVWSSADGGPLLLVGGGSGLAPLMSMVRDWAGSGLDASVLLLLSARSWDDVLYRDELTMLAARMDGFDLVLSVTREAPRRPGDFGRRVDTAMMRDVIGRLPAAPRAVFVCGTNGFVNAAADGALAAGVAPSIVRTERYGGV